MHFLYQCPSLSRHRYRLFRSPILVSLMAISCIDAREIKLSGWFSSVGYPFFKRTALALANFSLLDLEDFGQYRNLEDFGQYRNCVHLWRNKVLK